MKNDKDIDAAIDLALKKEITQEDKIDESVESHVSQMGFLWDFTVKKLSSDNVCFECKKPRADDKAKMQVIPTNSAPPGLVVFASICDSCFNSLNEKAKKTIAEKSQSQNSKEEIKNE